MTRRNCTICGASFRADRGRKTCSLACSRRLQHNTDRAAKERWYVRQDKRPTLASARDDLQGHWPKGKRRSNVDPAAVAELRRRVEKALRGRTKKSIAKLLGVSVRTLGRWQSGEDYPTPEHLARGACLPH